MVGRVARGERRLVAQVEVDELRDDALVQQPRAFLGAELRELEQHEEELRKVPPVAGRLVQQVDERLHDAQARRLRRWRAGADQQVASRLEVAAPHGHVRIVHGLACLEAHADLHVRQRRHLLLRLRRGEALDLRWAQAAHREQQQVGEAGAHVRHRAVEQHLPQPVVLLRLQQQPAARRQARLQAAAQQRNPVGERALVLGVREGLHVEAAAELHRGQRELLLALRRHGGARLGPVRRLVAKRQSDQPAHRVEVDGVKDVPVAKELHVLRPDRSHDVRRHQRAAGRLAERRRR